ncbi:hypothetical protein [Bartonella elizabethae]|nr:hypothetical protein [Bartonella elizabethae]
MNVEKGRERRKDAGLCAFDSKMKALGINGRCFALKAPETSKIKSS